MLKIVIEGDGTAGAVRAEGRVIGPWVDELARACEPLLAGGPGLVLDLGGVLFVDREGVELLRRLVARGATVVNSSRFVTEQLKG